MTFDLLSVSPEKAATEIGTFWTFSERFWAVTTIAVSLPLSLAGAVSAGGLAAGCSVPAVVAVAASCAAAGTEQRPMAKDAALTHAR